LESYEFSSFLCVTYVPYVVQIMKPRIVSFPSETVNEAYFCFL